MRSTSERLILKACLFVLPMVVACSAGAEPLTAGSRPGSPTVAHSAATGGPAADKPVADKPAADNPVASDPAADERAAETLAAAGAALARDKNCLACHQVDARRVGPPFASVAQRYAPPGGLRDYLAQSIRHGGRGKWGAVPMPAQPQVSEQEANQLADWILALPISAQPK